VAVSKFTATVIVVGTPATVAPPAQARFVPAAAERAARDGQVEKLLAEHNSQRSIVRVTGMARMTVAKLAKKAQQARPALPRLRPKSAT
jgi:hypothetical protein